VQPNPPLSGHGHGSYSYDAVESGAGIEYRLGGTASLSGMGTVGVSGSVRSVGFIQKGRAEGELTFEGPHGSITVELTGPTRECWAFSDWSFFLEAGDVLEYAGVVPLRVMAEILAKLTRPA
jgi:hypothetical protein